jgi:hypothetical protein
MKQYRIEGYAFQRTLTNGSASNCSQWIRLILLVLFVALIQLPKTALGYSLLTHEQIVDIAWKDNTQPLLIKRFPRATAEELRKAHAYAYGGCLIQDMGYYPFGNKFFSDLTHYVRSGDFVANLIHESTNLYEYAFALGALAHYVSDNCAHPKINRAVAMSFPKLRRKYGDEVTYEDDPKAHIRVEFGFDMAQVAKNRYTSDQYHSFIGFQVAKGVLKRAFVKTYGLKLDEVLAHEDLAINTFRRSVSQMLPAMTKVALEARRPEMVNEVPNFNEREFRFHLSRSEYEREWGKDYRKPGIIARILALFTKVVPKIGPFKALAFKIPTPETEDLYFKSVNDTVVVYESLLREIKTGHVELPNTDFDTGRPPQPGEYDLCDKAYAQLIDQLSKDHFIRLTPELRDNILAFYNAPPPPGKEPRKLCPKTLAQLAIIRGSPPSISQR